MKPTFNFKSLLPHLGVLALFLVITFIYFSPIISGKTLSMHDINMASAGAKELTDFHDKTGEWAWWTNSMFGGMPGFMIAGGYPYSLSSHIGSFITNLLPIPVNVIFLLMLGFYILMVSLKTNRWVAIFGAIGYAFGTYNLLYTEAGHLSKILALAFAPPLLAGIILVFRGKYFLGTFLTALFLALELYANHLQITYYFMLVAITYGIYELINLMKEGNSKNIIKIAACFIISLMIGVGMNSMRLWNNLTYASETMRGKSELTTSSAGASGLDRDYAFGWSYGIGETFNLMIPNLMGGGSSGSLSTKSETFKALATGGVDANQAGQFIQQLPLYHGMQPGTSGPSYSGIIIIFLFILGLFAIKNNFKWVNLGIVLLFIVLSWGSNFPGFNNMFYDNFPGYNKFRAVTMLLTVVHFLLVFGAANTLQTLFINAKNWENTKQNIIYALGTTVGLMILGYFMVDFNGANDEAFKTNLAQSLGPDFANKVMYALIDDRASLATSDIIRGIILILFSSGLIFMFIKDKIKGLYFGLGMIILVTFDMITVDKRYFNNDDFVTKSQAQSTFEPSLVDQSILQDTDPNFRVLNLTTSFWSEAKDSYFHKSIGGYHGAKLKKVQELYEYQMIKGGQLNLPIFNMLNTKYFITNDSNNQPIAQRNTEALGNAWFVDSLNVVDNADDELKALDNLNVKISAVTQKSYVPNSKTFKTDSSNKIVLKSYAPNKLVYESNAKSVQYAVFSEIFYRGNTDWISTIDGKETNHDKVNYVLRGMEIPPGKLEIVFEFKPVSVEKGKYIDLAASIGLILLALGTVWDGISNKKNNE